MRERDTTRDGEREGALSDPFADLARIIGFDPRAKVPARQPAPAREPAAAPPPRGPEAEPSEGAPGEGASPRDGATRNAPTPLARALDPSRAPEPPPEADAFDGFDLSGFEADLAQAAAAPPSQDTAERPSAFAAEDIDPSGFETGRAQAVSAAPRSQDTAKRPSAERSRPSAPRAAEDIDLSGFEADFARAASARPATERPFAPFEAPPVARPVERASRAAPSFAEDSDPSGFEADFETPARAAATRSPASFEAGAPVAPPVEDIDPAGFGADLEPAAPARATTERAFAPVAGSAGSVERAAGSDARASTGVFDAPGFQRSAPASPPASHATASAAKAAAPGARPDPGAPGATRPDPADAGHATLASPPAAPNAGRAAFALPDGAPERGASAPPAGPDALGGAAASSARGAIPPTEAGALDRAAFDADPDQERAPPAPPRGEAAPFRAAARGEPTGLEPDGAPGAPTAAFGTTPERGAVPDDASAAADADAFDLAAFEADLEQEAARFRAADAERPPAVPDAPDPTPSGTPLVAEPRFPSARNAARQTAPGAAPQAVARAETPAAPDSPAPGVPAPEAPALDGFETETHIDVVTEAFERAWEQTHAWSTEIEAQDLRANASAALRADQDAPPPDAVPPQAPDASEPRDADEDALGLSDADLLGEDFDDALAASIERDLGDAWLQPRDNPEAAASTAFAGRTPSPAPAPRASGRASAETLQLEAGRPEPDAGPAREALSDAPNGSNANPAPRVPGEGPASPSALSQPLAQPLAFAEPDEATAGPAPEQAPARPAVPAFLLRRPFAPGPAAGAAAPRAATPAQPAAPASRQTPQNLDPAAPRAAPPATGADPAERLGSDAAAPSGEGARAPLQSPAAPSPAAPSAPFAATAPFPAAPLPAAPFPAEVEAEAVPSPSPDLATDRPAAARPGAFARAAAPVPRGSAFEPAPSRAPPAPEPPAATALDPFVASEPDPGFEDDLRALLAGALPDSLHTYASDPADPLDLPETAAVFADSNDTAADTGFAPPTGGEADGKPTSAGLVPASARPLAPFTPPPGADTAPTRPLPSEVEAPPVTMAALLRAPARPDPGPDPGFDDDPFAALAAMAERYRSSHPAQTAPEPDQTEVEDMKPTPSARSRTPAFDAPRFEPPQFEAPEFETFDVPERAALAADDLDLPDTPFDEPRSGRGRGGVDAEFEHLLEEMSSGEPARAAPYRAREPAYRAAPQAPRAPEAAWDEPAFEAPRARRAPQAAPAYTPRQAFDLDADEPAYETPAYETDAYENEGEGLEKPRRRGRWLAALFGSVVIAGAAGAVAMKYTGLAETGAPLLVTADATPIKIRPDKPGGAIVPNQTNEVYDRVAGDKSVAPAQGKLLSSAEEPVSLDDDLPGLDMGEDIEMAPGEDPDIRADAGAESLAAPQAKGEDRLSGGDDAAPRPSEDPIAVTPRKVRTVAVRADGTLVQDTASPVVGPLVASANETLDKVRAGSVQADVTGSTTATPASDDQTAALAPVKTAASADAAWSMQIASQPTEDGARASYADLSKRYSGVLSGRDVSIVKTEITGKGTFWRVRVPAETRSAAVDLCTTYKAAGGTCFVSK